MQPFVYISLCACALIVSCQAKSVAENTAFATKAEKLISAEPNMYVEKAKEEIERQIQYNFLKTLSAIVVSGPMKVEDRPEAIVKLMRSVLNGEMNFMPVVEKLPVLVMQDEASRFTSILQTLKDGQRVSSIRQFGGLQNLDKILDAASKISLKEVSGFLKEIPEIFEGVETIVEGVDEYFA